MRTGGGAKGACANQPRKERYGETLQNRPLLGWLITMG